MRITKICFRFLFFLTILLPLAGVSQLNAQVTITQPLDILSGLADSTIQATVVPAFTNNSIEKVFDGNPLTSAGVQNSDSLVITLVSQDSLHFSRNKVYFWNAGNWSLEVANSLADLNSGSGSYQLLADQRPHVSFSWDSVEVSNVAAKVARLTATNLQSHMILLGEWALENSVTLTSLYIYPYPPRLLPGTHLQLKVLALDAENHTYPYPLTEPIMWSTDNHSVATVGEFGLLAGAAVGNTHVTASSLSGSISGSAPVSVETDFASVNDDPLTIKVALVLQDPVIDSTHHKRIHQMWGWSDPNALVAQIIEEFNMASDYVVQFQIVETIDDDKIFTRLDSTFMSIDTLLYYFTPAHNKLYGRNTPGTLQYMAEIENRVHFDYNAMVDYYDFDTKRNNGVINEIWVYTFPFGGMYESQLMGPGAFWWNSPPLAHPGLNKLLSVMGWNYERGVAEALHSFGHRMESAIRHVYGRWDITNPDPNNWELFTRIDKDVTGGAHVGNIHFPPNGMSDYDYGNTRYVVCYADNWKRYPYILDQTRSLNCSEWGCDQLGYMRWWFGHLPRFKGVYEGVLNNWWYYAVDYETAVTLAQQTNWVSIPGEPRHPIPLRPVLEQNFPNPFNPVTTIRFYLPKSEKVTLNIYDLLGRKVRTIINGKMTAGEHSVDFNARNFASGLYFYRLKTANSTLTKKMLIIK